MANSDSRATIAGFITELDKLAPAGFALGLHIKFTTPQFMFQTYPKKWVEIYDAKGLLLHDPVVQWGFFNTGAIRWRHLAEEDPYNVMAQAAQYGMTHGVTVATDEGKLRTVGGFARSDRDYLDVEIDELTDTVLRLHRATSALESLSDDDVAALKHMSDRLTRS